MEIKNIILIVTLSIIILVIIGVTGRYITPKSIDIIEERYLLNTVGEKGFKCPDPLPGLMGYDGPKGVTGKKGSKGMTGMRGLIGPEGESILGPTGVIGMTGPKGGTKTFFGTISLPKFNKISKINFQTGIGDISSETNIVETTAVNVNEIPYEWVLCPLNFIHNTFPYKYKTRVYIGKNDLTDDVTNMFNPLPYYISKYNNTEYTAISANYIPFDLIYIANDPRYTYNMYKFLSENSYNSIDPEIRNVLSPIYIPSLSTNSSKVYIIRAYRQEYGDGLSVSNNYIGGVKITYSLNQVMPYSNISDISDLSNLTSSTVLNFTNLKSINMYISPSKPYNKITITKLPSGRYNEEYFFTLPFQNVSNYLRYVCDVYFLVHKDYISSLNNAVFQYNERNDTWYWCKFFMVYGPNIPEILDNVYKISDYENNKDIDPKIGLIARRYNINPEPLGLCLLIKNTDYSDFTDLYTENLLKINTFTYNLDNKIIYTNEQKNNINVITRLIKAFNGGYALSKTKSKTTGDKVIFLNSNNKYSEYYIDKFFINDKDQETGNYKRKYFLAKVKNANFTLSALSDNNFTVIEYVKIKLDYFTYKIVYTNPSIVPSVTSITNPLTGIDDTLLNGNLKKFLNISSSENKTSLDMISQIPILHDNYNTEFWFAIVEGECNPSVLSNVINKNNLYCFTQDNSYTQYLTENYLIPANEPGGLSLKPDRSKPYTTSFLQYGFLRDVRLPVTDETDLYKATNYSDDFKLSPFKNFIEYKKETDILKVNNPSVQQAINFDDETGFFTREWFKFGLWYFETYLRQI